LILLQTVALVCFCKCNVATLDRPHDDITIPPALLLAGCTSAASIFPSIYLISLAYNPGSRPPENTTSLSNEALAALLRNISADASLEVRSGFFKICVLSRAPTRNNWGCSSNSTELSAKYGVVEDPLNLISLSANFQTQIVFYGLMYVFCTFSQSNGARW
jgi:Ca2+ regulator and membrane fusion protein Fig1